MVVLVPTAEVSNAEGMKIPKLDNFNGNTIGLLWNGRTTGDRILQGIVDIMEETYEIKNVVFTLPSETNHVGCETVN